jgi:amino acid transporter
MILSLINMGSAFAFNALLSLSTVALMATYILSVGCVALRHFLGHSLPPARWSLGRLGLPINVAALLYTVWGIFWSFWPNSYRVSVHNFNWTCVLFVGLMSISAFVYAVSARKAYEGLVAKLEVRRFN